MTTKRKEVDHIPWVWGSVPRALRAREPRYYELVYLSVCVLVVFSDRALTVVLQQIIITNTFYDLIFTVKSLWGFESKFLHRLHSVSVQYNL